MQWLLNDQSILCRPYGRSRLQRGDYQSPPHHGRPSSCLLRRLALAHDTSSPLFTLMAPRSQLVAPAGALTNARSSCHGMHASRFLVLTRGSYVRGYRPASALSHYRCRARSCDRAPTYEKGGMQARGVLPILRRYVCLAAPPAPGMQQKFRTGRRRVVLQGPGRDYSSSTMGGRGLWL